MSGLTHKQHRVCVVSIGGRWHVRTQQGSNDHVTVAVREHKPVADAIAKALREVFDQHTDDAFERELNRRAH